MPNRQNLIKTKVFCNLMRHLSFLQIFLFCDNNIISDRFGFFNFRHCGWFNSRGKKFMSSTSDLKFLLRFCSGHRTNRRGLSATTPKSIVLSEMNRLRSKSCQSGRSRIIRAFQLFLCSFFLRSVHYIYIFSFLRRK